jgi:agmatinase
MDSGDLDFPFGNTERVLDMIEERTASILADGKKPLMIGGEHLVTLGAVRAAVKKYHDLHIIHFDAHCDLRDNYIGDQLSHATVIRRTWELVGDGRIFQFGIRSGEKVEFEFAKEHTYLHKFDLSTFENIAERLKYKLFILRWIWTCWIPRYFRNSTPEAGGIGFNELVNAINKLKDLNIIACDMNELCPVYDQSGASTAAACKILREILLAIN